ncbi:hypothetical protein E2C01_044681 [Portunus trituberculatus]|uniref:Uncharacterized protein n=1 Tax=Portunus trituberculatus TaxID=210409 RepID=A0A5B7FZU3_PORTR|nr:hypothetical protein [Portunus trituberculatus]
MEAELVPLKTYLSLGTQNSRYLARVAKQPAATHSGLSSLVITQLTDYAARKHDIDLKQLGASASNLYFQGVICRRATITGSFVC